MARILLQVAALAVVAVAGALAVDVSTLQNVFNAQVQSDATLNGAAVTVIDTNGFKSQISGAFGYADRTNSDPMLLDSMVRMNTASELLVVAAALKLVAAAVLPSIDSTIPTAYLPQQVSLTNPNFVSTPITLRMLMQHTSTLTDSAFESSKRTSPTAVTDLRTFITSYFITTSGGINSLSSAVFSGTNTPGTAAAYSYARINTALLTFIVEMAIVANPAQVSSGTYTALAYVREQILQPLGMAETITMTTVGGFPTLSYPSNGPIFGERAVEDRTSAGTPLTTRSIHPAYFSDYMTFTSALDLSRIARALFLASSAATATSLTSIGTTMRSKLAVSSTVTGVTGTGLGLLYFNGATMCSAATATQMVSKCPLLATHNVWGFVGTGQFSVVGWFCTDAVSSTNPTCVTTAHSFNDAGTTAPSVSLSLAMAGAAFQLAIGDTTSVSQSTVSSNNRSDLYGVWVTFGVIGVVVFVILASFFTEYIIQPAPVIGGVPVPQSMMPAQGSRLPTHTFANN